MQKKEEIIENFKIAIKSTIKSLSNKDDIEISFGGQDVSSENNKLRLPEINELQNKINFDLTRAQADSESLKLRYSNKKILKSFEPRGSKAKKLYICNSTKDNDTPQFSQNQQIKSSIYFIKKRKKNNNIYNKYIDLLFIIKKNINIKNYLNYNENDLKKLHIKNIIKSSSENTNSIVVTESLQNCSKKQP